MSTLNTEEQLSYTDSYACTAPWTWLCICNIDLCLW